MHFSAIAVINETVTAHPLIFIVKTNEDIRSIRAKVLSVSFKPRKSASLQSEWSYAIRRHFLHTMATCPRSLKPHQWKISSKIDSGSFSIIFAAILVCDAFRAIWSIKLRTLKFAHTHTTSVVTWPGDYCEVTKDIIISARTRVVKPRGIFVMRDVVALFHSVTVKANAVI